MTRSVLRSGGQVVLVTPRQSPLRALATEPGVLAAHEGADLTDDLLAPWFDDQPGRRVLVIDDAELVKDAPAKTWLQGFVKRAADSGQAIVAAGLTAEFGVGFTGWQVDMKRARSGALLSPQAITEGDLLGMRLPRSSVVDRVQPGSAIVHLGDGELVSVQVPVPDPQDNCLTDKTVVRSDHGSRTQHLERSGHTDDTDVLHHAVPRG